jgi:MFS family permease
MTGPLPADPTIEEKRLLDRVLWRVMPFVTACMVIGTIDRSNVGFAKLSMAHDLGMSEAVFALGSSLFYIGYIAFEVPSTLGMHRFGARLWLTRIMFTWGLATIALAFTSSTKMFYILRFLLGASEAGLYPSLILYITLWLPRSYHARGVGMLTIGSAIGNGAGALISGPLLDMNGALGAYGWQWIFLVTGSIPILGTLVICRHMRDRIGQATFLTESEKEQLAHSVGHNDAPSEHRVSAIFKAMANLQVLAYGIGLATILTALYGVIYWSPTVVKTFGVTGTQNGLLVALPWAIDGLLLWWIPARLSSRYNLHALIILLLLGSAVFAAAALVESSLFRYAMLLIGIPCVSIALSFYWSFPARMLRGAPAAAALGCINSLGNFGGLAGQNLMPAVAKAGGSASAALLVPCVCLGVLALGAMAVLVRGQPADGRERTDVWPKVTPLARAKAPGTSVEPGRGQGA